MRGFLQKDIELLKQNRSFLGLVAVMAIFFVSVKNDAFIIIYLGMMGGFNCPYQRFPMMKRDREIGISYDASGCQKDTMP